MTDPARNPQFRRAWAAPPGKRNAPVDGRGASGDGDLEKGNELDHSIIERRAQELAERWGLGR